jgi:hypothetical protein
MPDLAFRNMEDEAWVLCTRDQQLHRLNATAALLWDLLEKEPTVRALAETLAREFDVVPAVAERDAVAFAESLRERGLVELLPRE